MNLLASMSIAGTVPVLICLFLYLFEKNSYHYQYGRRLLLTGIFFFLVPIQTLKYRIPKNPIYHPTAKKTVKINLSPKPVFIKEADGGYIWVPRWLFIFAILWAMAVFIFMTCKIWKYIKGMTMVKNCVEYTVNDPVNGLMYSVVPSDVVGACTIGFFRQKIIIPEHLLTDPDFLMIYRHEHRHLKNYDNLIKLVCMVVIFLHWMNPAAYLLLILYQNTAEMISDSEAVKDCTLEKKKDYARLLIEEATTRETFPVVWKNSFSANLNTSGRTVKIIKRRIDCMTKKKKKTGWKHKGMVAVFSLLIVGASAGTAMAYQPMYRSYDQNIKNDIEKSDYEEGWMLSSFDEKNAYEIMYCGMPEIDKLDFSKGDTIFISESGEQMYIDENGASAQASCSHKNTVDGYTYTHLKGSGESCSVITYKVTKCKDCDVVLKSSRYATVNYPVCPH